MLVATKKQIYTILIGPESYHWLPLLSEVFVSSQHSLGLLAMGLRVLALSPPPASILSPITRLRL